MHIPPLNQREQEWLKKIEKLEAELAEKEEQIQELQTGEKPLNYAGTTSFDPNWRDR